MGEPTETIVMFQFRRGREEKYSNGVRKPKIHPEKKRNSVRC